jgi:predicted lysophospholipase L1 biosynthesis ABC-type transport system permease subunit
MTRARPPQPSRQQAYRTAMITLLSSALGVAVGFAWNSAVTELNHALFEQPRSAVLAAFVWAAVVTVAAVVLIVTLRGTAPSEVPHMPEDDTRHEHGG